MNTVQFNDFISKMYLSYVMDLSLFLQYLTSVANLNLNLFISY